MAQLLSPPRNTDRISQLLPTVKCSNCSNTVPLADLGEHVCPQPPQLPRLSPSQAILARIRSPHPPSSPPSPQRPQPTQIPLSTHKPHVPRSTSTTPPAQQRTSSPLAPPAHPPRTPSPLAPTNAQQLQRPPIPPVQRTHSPLAPPAQPPTRPIVPPHSQRSQTPLLRAPPTPGPSTSRQSPAPALHPIDTRYRDSHHPHHAPSPIHIPLPPSPFPTPDTKVGGDAGMAGVGRRGFQAAAQAALFAANAHQHYGPGPAHPGGPVPGMDGRRANAPRYLNTTNPDPGRGTPPLSPGSGYSSHSPRSPLSQAHSPIPSTVTRPHPVAIADPLPLSPNEPSTSPRLPFDKFNNKVVSGATAVPPLSTSPSLPNSQPFPTSPPQGPPTPLSPSSGSDYSGLAYDDDDDEAAPEAMRSPGLRASRSESSVIGRPGRGSNSIRFPSLHDPGTTPRASTAFPGSTTPRPQSRTPTRMGSSASVSSASSSASRSSTRSATRIGLPPSPSSPSSTYSRLSRSTAHSMGALDSAMETLFEDSPTAPDTKFELPPPLAALVSSLPTKAGVDGDGQRNSSLTHANSISHPISPPERTAKLPARSRTVPAPMVAGGIPSSSSAPSVVASANGNSLNEEKWRVKVRECARCDRVIDDGRWINADGAGVLCERCWKMMYLPKCRRCNRPIEKQAVSSADGQLKGKYHRECFNCHTCHQPFPDKEFYVHDGKPFCRYHYHEANDSLCAARACGQPIEGACAVAHTGERYHPDHLTCEYEYPALTLRFGVVAEDDEDGANGQPHVEEASRRCEERLEEYWEVDGRMLCEHHALGSEGDRRGRSREREARARRRVTQFIDIR